MKAKQGKSKSSVSTKERILDGVLKLFNDKGETNVTTAQIADFLGISEGNLWYHFRTKREIVFELFCRLESEVDKNLSRLPENNFNLRDFMHYAARSFGYLWEFRFLYRDRFDDLKSEETIKRIRELTVHGQENIKLIFEDMRERKMLNLSTEGAEALTVNAWIVQSNWLRYLQRRENVQEITEEHIKEGFGQLIWLFKPYLDEEGNRQATAFIEEFSLKQFSSETNEKE